MTSVVAIEIAVAIAITRTIQHVQVKLCFAFGMGQSLERIKGGILGWEKSKYGLSSSRSSAWRHSVSSTRKNLPRD